MTNAKMHELLCCTLQVSLTASANGQAPAQPDTAAAARPASQAVVKRRPEIQKAAKLVAGRKFYGLGTQGTAPKFTLPLFRILAVLQVTAAAIRAVPLMLQLIACSQLALPGLLQPMQQPLLHSCRAHMRSHAEISAP